jgi:methylated-DNA-protein-cysteine methyltransferase-like protein
MIVMVSPESTVNAAPRTIHWVASPGSGRIASTPGSAVIYRDKNPEYKGCCEINAETGHRILNPDEKMEFRSKVWKITHSIPRGRVATYGQIASLADHPNQARLVGKIMSQLPAGSGIPWYRVLNAQGRITSPGGDAQKLRLAKEGVVLVNGRVNLKLYQWKPG